MEEAIFWFDTDISPHTSNSVPKRLPLHLHCFIIQPCSIGCHPCSVCSPDLLHCFIIQPCSKGCLSCLVCSPCLLSCFSFCSCFWFLLQKCIKMLEIFFKLLMLTLHI